MMSMSPQPAFSAFKSSVRDATELNVFVYSSDTTSPSEPFVNARTESSFVKREGSIGGDLRVPKRMPRAELFTGPRDQSTIVLQFLSRSMLPNSSREAGTVVPILETDDSKNG